MAVGGDALPAGGSDFLWLPGQSAASPFMRSPTGAAAIVPLAIAASMISRALQLGAMQPLSCRGCRNDRKHCTDPRVLAVRVSAFDTFGCKDLTGRGAFARHAVRLRPLQTPFRRVLRIDAFVDTHALVHMRAGREGKNSRPQVSKPRIFSCLVPTLEALLAIPYQSAVILPSKLKWLIIWL